jgi:pimeloyl-ACP methyl ester carboxylesterase
MRIKTETITTAGFSMDYFRFGHGDKIFVILPGLSVDSVLRYADAVADAYRLFSDDFTVYLFDRRKDLPVSYSVQEMARDTAEAFQALGLDPVYLFGASQGGMIAMTIAIEHPELVRRLVLGSTSACVSGDRYRLFEKWAAMAKTGKARDVYLAFGEALFPQDVWEHSRDSFAEAANGVTDADLKRFVILAEGIKGFDVVHDLEKIACPVLVIGSEDDQVLGAEASAQIAQRLQGRSDCELYLYKGYGHAAYDTAPDYRERILRFLLPGSTV